MPGRRAPALWTAPGPGGARTALARWGGRVARWDCGRACSRSPARGTAAAAAAAAAVQCAVQPPSSATEVPVMKEACGLHR
ncbi:hypothetical protein GCM10023329_52280 [Streptomyces sanyensis]|uniref:Secreted protein n=1 Tax=Streptomyces sanyensis TaxID=568869 RepID=A0ABP9BCG7_9ACTN